MAPASNTVMPAAEKPPVVAQDELVTGVNFKEMPEARFIENVEEFVGERDVTEVVGALQDLHARYKYLESGHLSQKESLKVKLPDIEGALDLVRYLQAKKAEATGTPLEVKYNLSENVYANAEVPVESGKILLWIGANVMLEYTFDEAEEMLAANFENATTQQAVNKEEGEFTRDQITTTEVNIARCHNYGVLQRQRQREKNKELEDKEATDK